MAGQNKSRRKPGRPSSFDLTELTGERLEEALRLAQEETARLEVHIKDIEESPNPFL